MIVVSILGGLGSQMCKYAFFLSMRNKAEQECLIDTSYYLQKNSWNGYELSRIFSVEVDDLKDRLNDAEMDAIQSRKSHYLAVCLNHMQDSGAIDYYFLGNRLRYRPSSVYEALRVIHHKLRMFLLMFGIQSSYPSDVYSGFQPKYFDEYSMNSDELFKDVKEEVLQAFLFPSFDDWQNIKVSQSMKDSHSVAIHVRRTDHLGDNGTLYKRHYYANAVNYIKSKDDSCSFYIFSDDIAWCKSNLFELGLSNEDDLCYVDWNSGLDSYKDMQLMTYCQHNVLAISSFSWWGYYLSKRKDKIVCAPKGYWLEVPVHV